MIHEFPNLSIFEKYIQRVLKYKFDNPHFCAGYLSTLPPLRGAGQAKALTPW